MILQRHGLIASLVIVMTAIVFACGESSDDEDEDDGEFQRPPNAPAASDPATLPSGVGQIGISGIDTLPDVVTPVRLSEDPDAETETFNAEAGVLNIDRFDLTATQATTGISLGSDTTGQSVGNREDVAYGACEMVNRARGFFQFAAFSDQVDCYLGFILGNSAGWYDGEPHIITLVEEDVIETMRFTIEGTQDNVSGLTFQSCENGVQSLYLRKTVDADGNVDIYSKRYSVPERSRTVDSFTGVTTVSGTQDENGRFADLKEINVMYSNQFSNGVRSFVKEQVVQSQNNLQYIGTQTQEDSEPTRIISFLQLIDQNTDDAPYFLTNLRLGDGAMVVSRNGDPALIQGWSGDTMARNPNATQIAKLRGLKESLPGVPTVEDLSFNSEEAWDCSGDSDLVIDEPTLEEWISNLGDAATPSEDGEPDVCTNFELPQSQYLECSQIATLDGE